MPSRLLYAPWLVSILLVVTGSQLPAGPVSGGWPSRIER